MRNLINIERLAFGKNKVVRTLVRYLIGAFPEQYLRGVEVEAEAEALKGRAKTGLDIEMQQMLANAGAEQRLAEQDRLASIVEKAAPGIDPDADPDRIDPDWIENFRSKGRHVTGEEMQAFWAHLLATETNKPGSFSKRTVNIVADMDRSEAELFTFVCGFMLLIDGDPHIFVDSLSSSIYRKHGLSLGHLHQLAAMGLITLGETGQVFTESREIVVEYHGRRHVLKREMGKTMPLGMVSLTPAGKELAKVVEPNPVPGFFEFCRIPLVSWVAHT